MTCVLLNLLINLFLLILLVACQQFHKKISYMIGQMIAADLHAANMVTGAGFKAMINFFEPTYQIPHPTTFMRTHIPAVLENTEKKVKSKFDGVTHVTFTTDCWQDDYAGNHYMSVTAHIIAADWEMQSVLLASVVMKGSITGQLILKKLREVQKEFGLESVTHSLVTDQGSNVILSAKLGEIHNLHCFAHRLDLCLTVYGVDKVAEFKTVLQKCKDIVKFFRKKGPTVKAKQEELRNMQTFMAEVVQNDHCYYNLDIEIPATSLKS